MAIPQVLYLLLVLWVAVCIGLCSCWGDSAADIARATAQDVQHGCAETTQYAKESAESMTDWTYDQFLLNKENARQAAQNIKNKAGDAASMATEKMKSAASGTSEYFSHKSGEAKEKLSKTMGYDKTAEAYNEVDKIIRMATDKASTDAIDILPDPVGYEGRDKTAEETYDQARHGVEEAYRSAKDAMTEENRINYEDAKEKASQVTGDLGASMRMSTS
ncbi:uncharacterized protein LOC129321967 [Prosopis cineraria]|uniref:uncharacterized protein LOC129321967 n=1 Tax=Prosopis cineraria TaxID=364024 RepID=UPI00240F8DC7|nr:uncharacterized protein LOC129321967 [Prosopis cineraria]XP_054823960.1 uncharacterized protein LOC129321967 [Prosopis cineraria]XP_054823961.1 uncharacterized protein LOC129321967 [Prosopis cineraria]